MPSQRCDGDGRIDGVDGVDHRRVDGEDAGRLSMEVNPAGGRGLCLDIAMAHAGGDLFGCRILAEIIGGKHGGDDFGDPGGFQLRQIIRAQAVRLAEAPLSGGGGMSQHRPLSRLDRYRAEFHAAAPLASRPRERKAWMV